MVSLYELNGTRTSAESATGGPARAYLNKTQ